MEDILNAIEELVEEARISGAHPDEPTNYREAHAALCSAIRSYGDERATAERERAAQVAHNRATQWDAIKAAQPHDVTAAARWREACGIARLILAP